MLRCLNWTIYSLDELDLEATILTDDGSCPSGNEGGKSEGMTSE